MSGDLHLEELRRAVAALHAARAGARLERVVQDAADRVVLALSGGGDHEPRDRAHLLLSCRKGMSRLSLLPGSRPAPPTPPAFAQYLRAHLEGGRFREARLRNEDRQASLVFETREGRWELLLSILGPRSNVYCLDPEGIVRAALRPIPDTRRDLELGGPWQDPPAREARPAEDRFADVEGEALLAAIEAHFASREQGADDDGRVRRVRQALKKQRSALERKQRALTRDLEEASDAAEWERRGELLKGSLRKVPAKASEVEVEDFATGETVVVPLDPKLSAADNMERCFKRHRKAVKQGLRASQQLADLAPRLESVDAITRDFDALVGDADPDPAALDAFTEQPEVKRLLERFAPAPQAPALAKKAKPRLGKREIPTRLQPRRYRTRDGLEVWVGKNDEGNDLLTTRLARGRDLFFHLEASPGSHVVLRTEGKDEPPTESVIDAAELSVHFSKHRNATRASVHIAAIKDVSKPKGAKPGLVYVHRGRTLQLRREPARLERLLASRIEDGSAGG